MNIPFNLYYPMHLPPAIQQMGFENMQPRHVYVLCMISTGNLTTRMILYTTRTLGVPPRHYKDLLLILNHLQANGLIHVQKGLVKAYHGQPCDVLSLTLEGYVYLNRLNALIVKRINKKLIMPPDWQVTPKKKARG